MGVDVIVWGVLGNSGMEKDFDEINFSWIAESAERIRGCAVGQRFRELAT